MTTAAMSPHAQIVRRAPQLAGEVVYLYAFDFAYEMNRMPVTKLRTLDELYQILRADQTNRTMLILEITIVVLFVIDLIGLIARFR